MKKFLVTAVVVSLLAGCSAAYAQVGGVWSRAGVVVAPRPLVQLTYEPTVLTPESGSVLFDTALVVWKMYYSGSGGISYSESLDGVHWRDYNEQFPVVYFCLRSFVIHHAGTYHLYCASTTAAVGPDKSINHYTSTDGVTFVLAQVGVISGNVGWNPSGLNNNSSGLVVDGVFYLFVEQNPDGIGLFTSRDFANFTPVKQIIPGNHQQGPTVPQFVNGRWWMWLGGNTGLPLAHYAVERWSAPELEGPWKNEGFELKAQTADEGVGTYAAQVIDPAVVEYNGRTYMFYSANQPTSTASQAYQSIKVAIADMPMSRLVTTLGGSSVNGWDNPEYWMECTGVSPVRSCTLKFHDSGGVRVLVTSPGF